MELNIQVGKKVLVTTSCWFIAPDGLEYKAVFGTVKAVRTAEETLGIRPNGRSTNWYAEIGNITIAGCQIHYAIQTETCNSQPAKSLAATAEVGCNEYERPCNIYFAD